MGVDQDKISRLSISDLIVIRDYLQKYKQKLSRIYDFDSLYDSIWIAILSKIMRIKN